MNKKIKKEFKELSDFFIMFCKSRFNLDVKVTIKDKVEGKK